MTGEENSVVSMSSVEDPVFPGYNSLTITIKGKQYVKAVGIGR